MRRALLVTNLKARTVSQRVKSVIVKALSADLDLEVKDTGFRNHATELARDAADRGFDLVISFGGDGTMNEVVNGLAGSDTPLAILPGGMANVLCRTLGIPTDIVEATGHLLNRIRAFETRSINIARADQRYFVLSCGVGLDAATVKRTEENPAAKRRYRDWFFLYSAFRTAFKDYRGIEPHIKLLAGDLTEDVVLAVVSNTPVFTYFKEWPVKLTPSTRIDAGLDVIAMTKFPLPYIPRLMWSVFRSGSHIRYRHTRFIEDLTSVTLKTSGEPFPVQVDGEYVGDRSELNIELETDALKLLT